MKTIKQVTLSQLIESGNAIEHEKTETCTIYKAHGVDVLRGVFNDNTCQFETDNNGDYVYTWQPIDIIELVTDSEANGIYVYISTDDGCDDDDAIDINTPFEVMI